MGSPKKTSKQPVKAKGKSAAAPAAPKKLTASKASTASASDATPKGLSAGDWFEKLVAIQKRLREPGGCPWDIEQTHQTLRNYLSEEAYEVLDAIDSGDDAKFTEELGDLLLQVTFHSQIASETNRFNISDVIQSIHDKMIRRHPHVFGDVEAKTSEDVLRNWATIKAEERGEKEGAASNGADGEAKKVSRARRRTQNRASQPRSKASSSRKKPPAAASTGQMRPESSRKFAKKRPSSSTPLNTAPPPKPRKSSATSSSPQSTSPASCTSTPRSLSNAPTANSSVASMKWSASPLPAVVNSRTFRAPKKNRSGTPLKN